VRSGERFETSGVLQWPDVPEKSSPTYRFLSTVRPMGVKIQCDQLGFFASLPFATSADSFQTRDLKIVTSVDLKPGQATVIGKTNAANKDGSLVLVLSANFVD
jgi:hypothetical protein